MKTTSCSQTPHTGVGHFSSVWPPSPFAAPVIGSFLLDSDAFADGHDQHGKRPPNQYGQNQTGLKPPPNQYGQNQTQQEPPPNQYGQNQTYGSGPGYGQKPPPNQYGQNQTQGTGPGRGQKEPCGPDDQNKGKGGKSQRRW